MRYGLIGEKLGHSFSKEIHAMFADYSYELKEIKRQDFDDFFKTSEFSAINVTIPYKQDVIKYLSFIDEKAEKIGAVNTVVNKNGKLYGYNTDYYGLKALLVGNRIDVKDKTVLILGTGGTSKTASCVVEDLGAKKIIKVSRRKSETAVTYNEAEKEYAFAEVIINTTPVGMYPNIDNIPIDLNKFENLSGVADAIYNPLNSKLVQTAKEKGINASGGLYMLVAQAAAAVKFFIGKEISESEISAVYRKILKSKQNLVLTGMPGCGKTTLGKRIAENLSREFIDTDAEIVKKCGIGIPEIFEKFGEDGFRKIETEVIAEISKLSGKVISTGGGAVLRPQNVFFLKQNGKILLIDRHPEHITATDGRPLSGSIQKIKQLYKNRINIYKGTADIIYNPVFSIDENVKAITEEFLNESISD